MNPGRALWYALKVEDYDLAEFLISSSTDIRQTYEFEPKQNLSTTSLMVLRMCQARSKGQQSPHFRRMSALFDRFLALTEECDLRCHCSKSFIHRCPLFIALKTYNIHKESELFDKKNEVVRRILMHGANIKAHHGQQQFIDVEGFRQYCYQKVNLEKSNGFVKNGFVKNAVNGFSTFGK